MAWSSASIAESSMGARFGATRDAERDGGAADGDGGADGENRRANTEVGWVAAPRKRSAASSAKIARHSPHCTTGRSLSQREIARKAVTFV